MAYTLEQIYLEEKERFGMKLIAGVDGLRVCVDWVHMVETLELVSFLKRNELVITTGVRNMKEAELTALARGLKENDAAGLIVNIGGYIYDLPQELVAYCDAEGFALFTLPWETRLVEFSHDACKRIMNEEHTEESITEAFLDGMLLPERRAECKTILSRYGFGSDTEYQLLVLGIAGGEQEQFGAASDDLQYDIVKILNRINQRYILFRQNQLLCIAAADCEQDKMNILMQQIEAVRIKYGYTCYCGIYPRTASLSQLANYYEKSQLLMKLAVSKGVRICPYEKLEVYKILMSVDSTKVLEAFCSRILGKLHLYDEANNTQLYLLLRQYFKCNGCIQDIADENFIHRNTVHYQLGKIEKLLDVSLENWEDRLKIHLCLMAEELL